MKRTSSRLENVEDGVSELKHKRNGMRGVMVSAQGDMYDSHGIIDRQDRRLERIEPRLDLHEQEMAEPPQPCDPEN